MDKPLDGETDEREADDDQWQQDAEITVMFGVCSSVVSMFGGRSASCGVGAGG